MRLGTVSDAEPVGRQAGVAPLRLSAGTTQAAAMLTNDQLQPVNRLHHRHSKSRDAVKCLHKLTMSMVIGDSPARRALALALGVLGLAGCPTVPLKQAENIGTAGSAYAEAVNAVAEFALTDALDYAVDELETRRPALKDLAKRREALERQNRLLKRRIELVETASLQITLVREYFTALETLAKFDVATPAGAATASLIDSLNALEKSIATRSDDAGGLLRPLTPDEKNATAQVASLVARGIHAKGVEARLTSDAPIIARHLRLLSIQLEELGGWISDRQESRLTTFYADHVEAPFLKPADTALPADWKTKYKQYLRGVTLSEKVRLAAEAGKNMERVWVRYLSGEQSPEELLQSVKDMQQLVTAIAGLRAARQAAQQSTER